MSREKQVAQLNRFRIEQVRKLEKEIGVPVKRNSFDQVLTYPDLTQWLADNLTGASAHLLDGEVIIHTGLTVEMNGELMVIEDMEEEE